MASAFISRDNYESLPDEQLASLFIGGNTHVFEIIAARYDKTISAYAHTFSQNGCDFDDLYQEGLIALYRAASMYDGSSAKFVTFASVCIRRRMVSYLRKSTKIETIPFDESQNEFASGSDTESQFIKREFLERLLEKADFHLSAFESRVFKAYVGELSSASVAKKLGVEVKSVDNALFRIRRKLSEVL